jgi:hypothetical protein
MLITNYSYYGLPGPLLNHALAGLFPGPVRPLQTARGTKTQHLYAVFPTNLWVGFGLP